MTEESYYTAYQPKNGNQDIIVSKVASEEPGLYSDIVAGSENKEISSGINVSLAKSRKITVARFHFILIVVLTAMSLTAAVIFVMLASLRIAKMHSDYQVLKDEIELIKCQMKEQEKRVYSSLASSMNAQVCHTVYIMRMNIF